MTQTLIKPVLERAGKYAVRQIPCPHLKPLSDLSVPRAGVLHTTEGGWVGSLSVFKQHFAPHFLVGVDETKKASIAQLIPVGVAGAACRGHNALALVQVEMVGYSKETPWVPDEATLDVIAALMRACQDEYGIPLTRAWKDGDYGRAGHNPHRSSGKFGHFAGWFGHGDMPDPDVHWDPGNLKWSSLFDRARTMSVDPRPTSLTS